MIAATVISLFAPGGGRLTGGHCFSRENSTADGPAEQLQELLKCKNNQNLLLELVIAKEEPRCCLSASAFRRTTRIEIHTCPRARWHHMLLRVDTKHCDLDHLQQPSSAPSYPELGCREDRSPPSATTQLT